ncbi:MAG TPA: helix-turn-helix transcriptional regulator, partial [Bryobacteraceae bacterium]|nr:helix-turn-helix transcriptional regulator [Bryobacteraceae bacterium]
MRQNPHAGLLLREWRQRRRYSQLELACEAGISSRHLSFIECGRSKPSREMIIRLAEYLAVPLRERNSLLTAGGYSHMYTEKPLSDPELKLIDVVLKGHEPYPALAIDRHWTLAASNAAVAPLLSGVDPSLIAPPSNVLRLSLHPAGLAPRIENLGEWRAHLLSRLKQQIDVTADEALIALREELNGYEGGSAPESHAYGGIAVPLRLLTDRGTVALISTTMIFGT